MVRGMNLSILPCCSNRILQVPLLILLVCDYGPGTLELTADS